MHHTAAAAWCARLKLRHRTAACGRHMRSRARSQGRARTNMWLMATALPAGNDCLWPAVLKCQPPRARSRAVPPRPRWRARAWQACAATWGPKCGHPTACAARC
eukprot:366230-Chlamydomonas_euryale.AAC.6